MNLKDILGLGSYGTAWHWLQKLRRCTIRKDRGKLSGTVEVGEFYIGGQKPGKRGLGANGKTIVIAAVERQGNKIGCIRLQVIPDCSSNLILPFSNEYIMPGSRIITVGWKAYHGIEKNGYTHHQVFQNKTAEKQSVLPDVHLVASLVKRLVIGTFQGRFAPKYLQRYLDEYVFRFNRRKSRSIGKKFMRIVQQVAVSAKTTYVEVRIALKSFTSVSDNSLGLSG